MWQYCTHGKCFASKFLIFSPIINAISVLDIPAWRSPWTMYFMPVASIGTCIDISYQLLNIKLMNIYRFSTVKTGSKRNVFCPNQLNNVFNALNNAKRHCINANVVSILKSYLAKWSSPQTWGSKNAIETNPPLLAIILIYLNMY